MEFLMTINPLKLTSDQVATMVRCTEQSIHAEPLAVDTIRVLVTTEVRPKWNLNPEVVTDIREV